MMRVFGRQPGRRFDLAVFRGICDNVRRSGRVGYMPVGTQYREGPGGQVLTVVDYHPDEGVRVAWPGGVEALRPEMQVRGALGGRLRR